jgi:hypothetical protein
MIAAGRIREQPHLPQCLQLGNLGNGRGRATLAEIRRGRETSASTPRAAHVSPRSGGKDSSANLTSGPHSDMRTYRDLASPLTLLTLFIFFGLR